jgi:DNA-binding XRE family transcriptional regulator
MINGGQIRAARALLHWSSEKAARKTGLSRQTLHRLETALDIPPSRTKTLVELKRVFEEAGIEFIGAPGEGPGVRLWKKAK